VPVFKEVDDTLNWHFDFDTASNLAHDDIPFAKLISKIHYLYFVEGDKNP
jgi:hypothetical protein